MENTYIYEQAKSVPESAKKTIKGGRISGMTDINPMWRIKILTELFGPCGIGWYYIPTKKWMESHGEETAAFVDIELYIKTDGEWSKPISGTGGSSFSTKEKNGVYVSDECFKMATTDAISVACKQLGIGADVYWDDDRTKYGSMDSKCVMLSKDEISALYCELARTGIGKKNLCANYKVKEVSDLSKEQYSDAMQNLKKKPDKKPDPSTIPPDDPNCGLPFN